MRLYSTIFLILIYLFSGIFFVFALHISLNWIIESRPLSFSPHVVFINLFLYKAEPIDFNPNLKTP